MNTAETNYPEIKGTAARLADTCESCGNHLARFDCDNCGKRTCNYCEIKSDTLTHSRFCSANCVTEAEEIAYRDQKAGC